MSHSPEIEERVEKFKQLGVYISTVDDDVECVPIEDAIDRVEDADGKEYTLSEWVEKALQTTQKETAEGIVGEMKIIDGVLLETSQLARENYNQALTDLTTHIQDKYLRDKK